VPVEDNRGKVRAERSTAVQLQEFNQAPEAEATQALLACCDVPRWAAAVRDGRPYHDVDAILAVADRSATGFTTAEVDRALAAHPRIGERAERGGVEAGWSRQEQSGIGRDTATQAALVEGNRAYERRFGRVFLICATGLSGEEILHALRSRFDNDTDAEEAVVAEELRKIALLRLRKLVAPAGVPS
jgi:2-oxo-4-hydroxy-4-carboxy-5-ureidoimidazoline decarboxylase